MDNLHKNYQPSRSLLFSGSFKFMPLASHSGVVEMFKLFQDITSSAKWWINFRFSYNKCSYFCFLLCFCGALYSCCCSLLPFCQATKTVSTASTPLPPESAQTWAEFEHLGSTSAPLASLYIGRRKWKKLNGDRRDKPSLQFVCVDDK